MTARQLRIGRILLAATHSGLQTFHSIEGRGIRANGEGHDVGKWEGTSEKGEVSGRRCDLRRGPHIQQTAEGDCRLQIVGFKTLFERRFGAALLALKSEI
jgi:hypothetical protein